MTFVDTLTAFDGEGNIIGQPLVLTVVSNYASGAITTPSPIVFPTGRISVESCKHGGDGSHTEYG